MIKVVILISFIFFLSELALAIVKRSKVKTTKHRKDRGSLVLLWVMITVCLTLGFTFAKHRVWDVKNYIVAFIGLIIMIAGFTIRWIAILKLKQAFTVDVAIGKDHELVADGIYKKLRHPSYLGLLLILAGLSVCTNSIVSILVVVVPMFFAINYRISVEELVLIDEFGVQYKEYITKTYSLVPYVY